MSEAEADLALAGARRVVLYLHGNMVHFRCFCQCILCILFVQGTMALGHRVELLNSLTETMAAHVVTIDYRGFGVSTGSPTEEGLIEDALLDVIGTEKSMLLLSVLFALVLAGRRGTGL